MVSAFGVSWYGALLVALIVAGFGLHKGLCEELHRAGWLADRINRFTVGAIVLVSGTALNVATWGWAETALHLDLPHGELASLIALELRPVSRPLQTVGALLMIAGLSDTPREWLAAWGAILLVWLLGFTLVVLP